MKYHILIRHGAYNPGENKMNERGHKQISQVIRKIKNVHSEITVCSSTGPRAMQTAELIGASYTTNNHITDWLECFTKTSSGQISTYVSGAKLPVILVTNGEFIHRYVEHISQEFGYKNPLKKLIPGEVLFCILSEDGIVVEYL